MYFQSLPWFLITLRIISVALTWSASPCVIELLLTTQSSNPPLPSIIVTHSVPSLVHHGSFRLPDFTPGPLHIQFCPLALHLLPVFSMGDSFTSHLFACHPLRKSFLGHLVKCYLTTSSFNFPQTMFNNF